MTTVSPTWYERALGAVRALGARPAALFCLLLALNGLVRPYAPFIHDAGLYGIQVLNQLEGGAFADDLFLRYGSQDQYSLFSRVAAPLAGVLGIEATFFLLYLAFNSLFLFALKRLIERLVPDRALSTIALIVMAIMPLPFGGHGIFHVHESFLTPRILANALVLFALDEVLRQRYGRALLLVLAAGIMHPLMAFGGFMIWAGCLAAGVLSRRTLAALVSAGAAAGLAVLAIPPLGMRVFGYMDNDWRMLVHGATMFNFPAEWGMLDWLNVVLSFVPVLGVAWLWRRTDPERARFLLVVAAAGAVGLLGTVIGSESSYALLFQGQPYRVLWILKAVQIPLALVLARHLMRETSAGWAGVLLVGAIGISDGVILEFVLPLMILPIVVIVVRSLEQPTRSDWLARSLAISIGLGLLLWSLMKVAFLLQNGETFVAHYDVQDYVRSGLRHLGVVAWVLLAAVVLVRAARGGFGAAFRAGALLAALGVQTLWFLLPTLPAARERLTRYGADIAFINDYLHQQHAGQRLAEHREPVATIYCFIGQVQYVWVDCRAMSYFDVAQGAGALFHRDTAMEAHRRAKLAAPFEIARIQEDLADMPDYVKRSARQVYNRDLDSPPPTRDDVERLSREPDIDFLVLKQNFPELAPASNGRVFIYDCRHVRAQAAAEASALAEAASPSKQSYNDR